MGRKNKNARTRQKKKLHINRYLSKKARRDPGLYNMPPTGAAGKEDIIPTQYYGKLCPHQYEIWFARLGNHYNTSIQSGCRPVLIISNEMANRHSRTFTVFPMTSKMKKLELPTHVLLDTSCCGMNSDEALQDSVLLVEQVTTVDRSMLTKRLCCVTSEKKIQEIRKAIAVQFGTTQVPAMDIRATTEITENKTETEVNHNGS